MAAIMVPSILIGAVAILVILSSGSSASSH
jgi:hypothetical protein